MFSFQRKREEAEPHIEPVTIILPTRRIQPEYKRPMTAPPKDGVYKIRAKI